MFIVDVYCGLPSYVGAFGRPGSSELGYWVASHHVHVGRSRIVVYRFFLLQVSSKKWLYIYIIENQTKRGPRKKPSWAKYFIVYTRACAYIAVPKVRLKYGIKTWAWSIYAAYIWHVKVLKMMKYGINVWFYPELNL